MNVGVVRQKSFFVRVEEVSAVVDRGLLAWSPTEDFRTPGISDGELQKLDITV